jgi:hypothetical protein
MPLGGRCSVGTLASIAVRRTLAMSCGAQRRQLDGLVR